VRAYFTVSVLENTLKRLNLVSCVVPICDIS
jgi:hypothetical protein